MIEAPACCVVDVEDRRLLWIGDVVFRACVLSSEEGGMKESGISQLHL